MKKERAAEIARIAAKRSHEAAQQKAADAAKKIAEEYREEGPFG